MAPAKQFKTIHETNLIKGKKKGESTMIVTIKGQVLEIKAKEDKQATDVTLYQPGERYNPVVRIANGLPIPKLGEAYQATGSLLQWQTRGGGVGSMVSVREQAK